MLACADFDCLVAANYSVGLLNVTDDHDDLHGGINRGPLVYVDLCSNFMKKFAGTVVLVIFPSLALPLLRPRSSLFPSMGGGSRKPRCDNHAHIWPILCRSFFARVDVELCVFHRQRGGGSVSLSTDVGDLNSSGTSNEAVYQLLTHSAFHGLEGVAVSIHWVLQLDAECLWS